MFIIEITFVSS